MRKLSAIILLSISELCLSQIRVNPNGVNVNSSSSTTVFLTFGRIVNQVPVEAFWCGELISAAPDIGFKCSANSLFGQLPIRYDLSKINPDGTFTDIMSIPSSVARRAYQAAQQGAASEFFYVRRFQSLVGGPDEYVTVTCRMAGGGARVPFAIQDVTITADTETPVVFVKKGETGPELIAEIYYNGSGQLKGRWEVVMPGEEPPTARDLLTEAALPIEERGLQRRYTEIGRFNVFLPPTGKFLLPGPKAKRLPTAVDGLYMVLLRIEASDDKEGDSSLGAVGAGSGVIHSGAVAGFPLPPFRYYVGNAESELLTAKEGRLQLLFPAENAAIAPEKFVDFSWVEIKHAAIYRLDVKDSQGQVVLSAMLQSGVGTYRAPSWLKDRASGGSLNWHIAALNFAGDVVLESEWRALTFQ
ncbi:MAG TPA: hypothetical protein VGA99_00925 [bacterium]